MKTEIKIKIKQTIVSLLNLNSMNKNFNNL